MRPELNNDWPTKSAKYWTRMSSLSEQLERMKNALAGKGKNFGIFVKFEELTPENKLELKGQKGDKGDPGRDGKDGKNAPELSEIVQAVLPHAKGDKGDRGERGENGKDGKTPDIKTIAVQVKKEINIPTITLEELEKKLESRDKKLWERIKGLVAKVAASVGGKGGGAGIEIVDESEIIVSGAGRIVFSGDGVAVTQISNNGVLVTIPGGSGGTANILTELIGSTQNGNNVEIDLTDLSQPYTGVLLVIKNGQVLNPSNPTFGWSKTGDIITVLNAATSDEWMIQFTF